MKEISESPFRLKRSLNVRWRWKCAAALKTTTRPPAVIPRLLLHSTLRTIRELDSTYYSLQLSATYLQILDTSI